MKGKLSDNGNRSPGGLGGLMGPGNLLDTVIRQLQGVFNRCLRQGRIAAKNCQSDYKYDRMNAAHRVTLERLWLALPL